MQESTIFFIQLNDVNKPRNNKMLPPYINNQATRWHIVMYGSGVYCVYYVYEIVLSHLLLHISRVDYT